MDADHGNTDRPRGITNSKLKVFVMSSHILLHKAVLDKEVETIEYFRVAILLLEQFE